jgi:hypothetical protein
MRPEPDVFPPTGTAQEADGVGISSSLKTGKQACTNHGNSRPEEILVCYKLNSLAGTSAYEYHGFSLAEKDRLRPWWGDISKSLLGGFFQRQNRMTFSARDESCRQCCAPAFISAFSAMGKGGLNRMDDLEVFVRGYNRGLLSRVRYAGTIDPQKSDDPDYWEQLPTERRAHLLNDDPNFSFRSTILDYLFGSCSSNKSAASEVSDELIHDLFVAHWEFAVGHDCPGHEELATEVLRRGLFETFAHAYRLPLGMDQGVPLEIAIGQKITLSGRSPVSQLLLAIDRLFEREAGTAARSNLTKWRHFIAQKYPQEQT